MFIQDHGGIQPGMLHLLVSSTGTGKTSIARRIILSCAKLTKVLLYSSEEDEMGIRWGMDKANAEEKSVGGISLIEERELLKYVDAKNSDLFLSVIRNKMIETGADVFFFDNITTSAYYQSRPEHQDSFALKLYSLTQELNKAFFVIAHTMTEFKNNKELINDKSIRGSKMFSQKAEYFYGFQRVLIGDFVDDEGEKHKSHFTEKFFSFVNVVKSRYGKNQGDIYRIFWDEEAGTYDRDFKLDGSTFKKIWNMRFRL
jgi:KaiC/GvpD/RAD55 family RecA-like ATPase